jgi:hypothetical protein
MIHLMDLEFYFHYALNWPDLCSNQIHFGLVDSMFCCWHYFEIDRGPPKLISSSLQMKPN